MFIGPVHGGPTTNDIFPKLTDMHDPTLIDASSGYHNLKLDEKSSHLTKLVCHFGRYRYARLPFSTAPAEDMFQRKIDNMFKELPTAFGILDDILVVRFDRDSKDHDATLQSTENILKGKLKIKHR